MKTHARVVVIGGGAVGCSALYHLTQLGVTDAVLLERDELTAGLDLARGRQLPEFLDVVERDQAAASQHEAVRRRSAERSATTSTIT